MAPTGVDPVTFRFAVNPSPISYSIYTGDILLISNFSRWWQLLAVGFRAGNGPRSVRRASSQPQASESGDQVLPGTSLRRTGSMKAPMSSLARSADR